MIPAIDRFRCDSVPCTVILADMTIWRICETCLLCLSCRALHAPFLGICTLLCFSVRSDAFCFDGFISCRHGDNQTLPVIGQAPTICFGVRPRLLRLQTDRKWCFTRRVVAHVESTAECSNHGPIESNEGIIVQFFFILSLEWRR